MKKFYFAGTLVILALSAVFLGYGMHLNSTSNSYIEAVLASRAVSLSGVRVSRRDLYPRFYLGHTNLRTRMQADAVAHIDGLIDELYVTQEQQVKQGQPIGRIVNYDVPLSISRADTDVTKAEAAYLQSAGTVERNKRLAAEDAIAASELEMSLSQMKASQAELEAARIARRQIEQQSGFQVLTAPLSGTVIMVYLQPGNYVTKGAPVAMIADFSKMYFTALVDDKKIRNVTPLEGSYSLLLDLENMTDKAFDSAARSSFNENTAFGLEISSVSPPLSESVPVRSVTCEIDNSLGVMEIGMYTDLVIRKDTPVRALAVPLAAVFDKFHEFDGDDAKVCIRDADSKLAVRGIKTGVDDGEYVEVVEGLDEGDVVITSGIEGLDPGMRIDVNLEEDSQ